MRLHGSPRRNDVGGAKTRRVLGVCQRVVGMRFISFDLVTSCIRKDTEDPLRNPLVARRFATERAAVRTPPTRTQQNDSRRKSQLQGQGVVQVL